MEERDYLHGYTSEEQNRLVDQALFLEKWVYDDIDLSKSKKVLEVGCGVGAQTQILLRRFPHLNIHGVDISQAQIAVASERLAKPISEGQVKLTQADATKLPDVIHGNGDYDTVFICWFLEHVPEPVKVLESIKKVVKPGARIIITEVNNSSLFVDPYSPSTLKYWSVFNDFQWMIQGHPFVGLQVGNMLAQNDFKEIKMKPKSFFFDSQNSDDRQEFLEYFFTLMKSANENLVNKGRIHHELIHEVEKEFDRAVADPNSVFFYSYMRAEAIA